MNERSSKAPTLLATAAAVASLVALPLGVGAAAPGPGQPAPFTPAHATDRIIVGFEPGATARQRTGVAGVGSGAISRLSPLATDAALVELAPGQRVAEALGRYRAAPGVAYAEPDYWLEPAETADDPWYLDGNHWGMYGGDTLPHANPYGSAAAAAWAAGHVGAVTVHVGVVDEGVKIDHPDLAGNAWTNPAESVNGRDDDGNGYVDDLHGWDFHDDDAAVYDGDSDDHGTHVAGTIGARGGNGIGVAGVAWRVSLIPAKFMGPAGGYTSDAVRALDYLTDLRLRHGIRLVASNNSWSGGGYSQALADAIARGGDAGIIFVAAAGNGGTDIDASPVYPGAYTCTARADGSVRGWDCLLSVASLAADGSLDPDSDRGATGVDLAAPGVRIVSTHPRDDGYAYLSGTSMAAAHVTGAVALCAGLDPSLAPERIRELIVATGTPTGSLAGRTVSGRRLDVAALAQACVPTPAPTPTPTPSPESSLTPTPSPAPPPSVTVYVDDLDPAFRRYGPGWNEADEGHAGHLYWLPTRDGARTAYGSWKPILPVAGDYRVMARIPVTHATSRKAAYRIRTAEGWVTRVRSQDKRQGSWVSLGEHALTTTPIVQLADDTGEPPDWGRELAYDAVRFLPVDRVVLADGSEDQGLTDARAP